MNAKPELLPCPFCGSENLVVEDDFRNSHEWVKCGDCKARGPYVPEDVKDYWNTRPAPAVEVKPLEWVDDKDAEVWTKAVTQIGTYFICDDTDDFSGFYVELISHDNARWWQHVRSTSEMIMDRHHDDDLSPLKSAAQADYERRILSALSPQPPLSPQEAARVLLSACGRGEVADHIHTAMVAECANGWELRDKVFAGRIFGAILKALAEGTEA